jgi:hypothetical protein
VHLRERLAPQVSHPRQRGLLLLIATTRGGERLGLDHHQRYVVRDHVVELAGDAQPLLGHRVLCHQLLLALESLGALVQTRDVVGPGAKPEADRHREPDRHESRDDASCRQGVTVH